MKKIISTLFIVGLMACCAFAQAKKAPIFYAHQGECTIEPPNTAAAVKTAFELGSKYVEIDLFMTKSGELVCIHCNNQLKSMWETGGKKVEELTKEDILKTRLKKGYKYAAKYPDMHISTLDDVFKVTPKNGYLIIDARGFRPGYAEKFDEAIARAGLERSKMILPIYAMDSFRKLSKEYNKGVIFIWLSKKPPEKNLTAEQVLAGQKKGKNFKFLKWLGIGQAGFGAKDYCARLNDKDYFRKFRAEGIAPCAWTTDDPEIAKVLIDEYDVEVIATNKPAEMRKALGYPKELKKPRY